LTLLSVVVVHELDGSILAHFGPVLTHFGPHSAHIVPFCPTLSRSGRSKGYATLHSERFVMYLSSDFPSFYRICGLVACRPGTGIGNLRSEIWAYLRSFAHASLLPPRHTRIAAPPAPYSGRRLSPSPSEGQRPGKSLHLGVQGPCCCTVMVWCEQSCRRRQEHVQTDNGAE